MMSLKKLLDNICTEAISDNCNPMQENYEQAKDLPPIQYNLELIEDSEGNLYWIE